MMTKKITYIAFKKISMIYTTLLERFNHTPLLELTQLDVSYGKIFAKAEFLQPGGSIKDRAALQIIKDAYSSGKLKQGQAVVEMTSGNMGAGLALVCRQFGNPFTAVMSKGNSPERQKILKAFGAEVILTDQIDGQPGMVTGNDIQHAADIAKQISDEKSGFYVDQFNNPSSVQAHIETTGPEIFSELPEIDVFISTIGSGGTFIGTATYLKAKNPNIKCVAVEPENAAIIKTGAIINSNHIIQGTGYGLIPPHWDDTLCDEIITVTDQEVCNFTKLLSIEHGLYVGYSSGANVLAAMKYLKNTRRDLSVVTVLCDTGYKYSDL